MMKNGKILKILSLLLVITFILPITVKAETLTYGNVLDELEKAKKELEKNNQSLGNTQGQIEKDNDTIKKLRVEIQEMKDENTKLQQEIAQANEDIDLKKEQTKDIIVYLQMSQGENAYLEYIFGSDSITDMVYRLSIVEQITEYNDNMIKELEELITANEKRKVELAKKESATEQKIIDLNEEIAKLNKTVSNLNSLAPSLEDEVKSQEKLVEYYKSQGCSKRSDRIGIDCAKTSSNAVFSRPITNGYINSNTGYRYIFGEYTFHKGIDIGSPTGKNTPIYSIGKGTITSVYHDLNGALCIRIEYKDAYGQYYTAVYGHLSRYANGIYVGMSPKTVDSNTLLGYMGDTGKVTGVHLHLEVWPCRYGIDSNCNGYYKYESFAKSQFDQGKFKGAESVINFPSRWYSR